MGLKWLYLSIKSRNSFQLEFQKLLETLWQSLRTSEDTQKELQSEMWGRGLVATSRGYL